MSINSLSPEERLNAAIQFEKVDRIPCAPLIDNYAARFANITHSEFFFNSKNAFNALASIKERYPVWDIRRSSYSAFYGKYQKIIGHLKNKLPGIELPDNNECQYSESEVMKRENLSIIKKSGYEEFINEYYHRIHGSLKIEIKNALSEQIEILKNEIKEANRCGQTPLYGYLIATAEEIICYTRSFPEFIRDIYQVPGLMHEILSIVTDSLIEITLQAVKQTGVNRVLIGFSRMNGQFFSPYYFEKFCWINLKRIILSFIDQGITPVIHIDGDWTLNLPYFRQLPEKKMIIELDGNTDIFKAKKILKNHTCLLGNVPSTLFTVGTPEQVKEYCRKLLTKLSRGGGFILGSGCALPYMARHENVEAFFESIS
ncbi:MAG: uroporphyrinogen-III decarboxylase [Spirochaetes bacterium]|nr:uroporphyrinogen-III decarboxylase [Spirochaetota bacterium]